MKFDFRIELMDSVEEVPLPGRLSEVLPFVRTLWAFQAGVFWMLALEVELMLMLFLLDRMPWLGKRRFFEERLYRLCDGMSYLRDKHQCRIHWDLEVPSLPEAARGLIKAVKYVWGLGLCAEGSVWQFFIPFVSNKKVKVWLSLRVVKVCVTGWNLRTDGRAWPNFR